MNELKSIGGYFELELNRNGSFIHSDGVCVNSGRHALEYILRALPEKPSRIYLPYFTCEVVLQPLSRLEIPYSFYHINEKFEIAEPLHLADNEYVIANNYFGLKDEYVAQLAAEFGPKLIIDNSQAWYAPAISGIKAFYSPRKFFGVPDGGVAYTNDVMEKTLPKGTSWHRTSHLVKRIDIDSKAGYADFRSNSASIASEELTMMSSLAKALLSSIDMDFVKDKRRENYGYLAERLNATNMLSLPDQYSFDCPLVYPYLPSNKKVTREGMINDKIFVATYWPNVLDWTKPEMLEYKLTKSMINVPIDQRYDCNDMQRIVDTIEKLTCL